MLKRPEWFDKLVIDNWDHLLKHARILTRNSQDCEDIVQETMTRAINSYYRFEEGTDFCAWTYTIMKYVWFDRCNKTNKKTFPLEDWMFPSYDSPQEDSLFLKQALPQIKPRMLEAGYLVNVLGCDCAEAAKIANIPEGTIKSRSSRCRERIRELETIE